MQVLESLGDASYTAGILGVLISLCRSLNNDEQAAQVKLSMTKYILL